VYKYEIILLYFQSVTLRHTCSSKAPRTRTIIIVYLHLLFSCHTKVIRTPTPYIHIPLYHKLCVDIDDEIPYKYYNNILYIIL